MKNIRAKRIVSYIAVVLLAVVLIINVVTAILSVSDLRTRLGWLPYAALSVEGSSMSPEISSGDLIIVRKTPFDSLNVGDDVTFWTRDGLVTHRVVRESADGYVTRGLANDIDDLYTMRRDEYCGKVVLGLPAMGYVLKVITTPIVAVLSAVAIVAICFGRVIFEKLSKRRQNDEGKKNLSIPKRALVCVSALSMLLCLPYMTDAKYIGQVNDFDMAVAQPLYFSSNYLSPDAGNTYSIQGWDGKAYPLTLNIRNYDNSLLYNRDDIDLAYGFGIKIYTDDGSSGDYSVTVAPPENSNYTIKENFNYPSDWSTKGITPVYALGADGTAVAGSAYQIAGGAQNYHRFAVTILPNAEPMAPKTKIHFEIYAATEQGETYFLQLKGTFKLQVAEASNFIGETKVDDLSSMVNLSVKTNLTTDGSNEKIVLFKWDPEKMYINEFESTAFNIIANYPEEYYSKEEGKLYIKMQAYSKINLEFFKKNYFVATADDITIQVVDKVGDDPTVVPIG